MIIMDRITGSHRNASAKLAHSPGHMQLLLILKSSEHAIATNVKIIKMDSDVKLPETQKNT